MPINAKPEKRITLAHYQVPSDAAPDERGGPRASVVDTYTSHFATCPNAAQHRGKR